jgi:hypothetical protein
MYQAPQRRSRMGAAAAEKVKQFDKDNVHAQMKKIYLSA